MKYNTFEIAIATDDGLDFLSVVACDLSAALADVNEAYSSPDIVSVTIKA